MLDAWSQHLAVFVTLSVVVVVALLLGAHVYLKNRNFRHEERLASMQEGYPRMLFLSEKLLRYVPWEFWASLVLLILLAALFLVCSYSGLSSAGATLLELIKYVTGAVIGSLFGKNKRVEEPDLGVKKGK